MQHKKTYTTDEEELRNVVDDFIERDMVPEEVADTVECLREKGHLQQALRAILTARK